MAARSWISMRTPRRQPYPAGEHEEVIANFGEARLVKTFSGKYSLIGGTEADRRAAREMDRAFLA